MKTTQLAVAVLAMAFSLNSCKKDDNVTDPAEDPVEAVSNGSYFPTSAGSTWNYDGDMTYTVTATGRDTTIDGEEYSILLNSQDGEGYMRYADGDYIVYDDIELTGEQLTLLYLKDDVPVGTAWDQVFTTQGIEVIYKYSIAEKGMTKTVGGKTYQNVIHVNMLIGTDFLGSFNQMGETDYFYADGVGFIASEGEANVHLTDYSIN